jgi:hypothetical protein
MKRLLLSLLVALGGPASGQTPSEALLSWEFPRLNRTYSAFIEELAPVEVGAARILLSSPDHSLTLLRHRARLRPDGDGGHHTRLEVEFSARGRIDAAITFGRVQGQLHDDVVVPLQSTVLEGRVALRRGEDGYVVTTLALPQQMTVAIESELGSRLVSLCHQFALVLIQLDCQTLETALTSVTVSLPPPGESYLLPDAELTDEDRKSIESYLRLTAPTSP